MHVPFCARRCSYCDFSIAVRRQVPWREYAAAIHRECSIRQVQDVTGPLSTLYFGGGTPSRLGPDGVQAMLDALRQHVMLADNAEVTLEANPEDITPSAVEAWREAGINRLSIGVQSFDDLVLSWMHRVHDAAGAERAIAAARAGGIDAFSLDLIFATPDRLARQWNVDLERVIALQPDHVSLYGLTVEPHTPLGRWHARGQESEASEERYEREFLAAHERLQAAGFEHYEVSNFARPGRRARHNSAYWRGVPYLGLGPSAHGYDGVARRWNVEAYAAWDRAVRDLQDPVGGEEVLTDENRIAEGVYLGLRTHDGLFVSECELAHMAEWERAGWITVHRDADARRVVCTAQGWMRLDALAADLTAFRSGS
ncbi:radical SAM family heme chaperone HemW [Gemmatimonas phototrophica]|uniref:radical SAM family heme chaperone HemW n=1 Tax=Gemmatimonas phototrophica TaxID=1379270 RepID=UPI001314456E|nr:radical SAM family heme chaperone HemW [Gemmatimonas phototrophica]